MIFRTGWALGVLFIAFATPSAAQSLGSSADSLLVAEGRALVVSALPPQAMDLLRMNLDQRLRAFGLEPLPTVLTRREQMLMDSLIPTATAIARALRPGPAVDSILSLGDLYLWGRVFSPVTIELREHYSLSDVLDAYAHAGIMREVQFGLVDRRDTSGDSIRAMADDLRAWLADQPTTSEAADLVQLELFRWWAALDHDAAIGEAVASSRPGTVTEALLFDARRRSVDGEAGVTERIEQADEVARAVPDSVRRSNLTSQVAYFCRILAPACRDSGVQTPWYPELVDLQGFRDAYLRGDSSVADSTLAQLRSGETPEMMIAIAQADVLHQRCALCDRTLRREGWSWIEAWASDLALREGASADTLRGYIASVELRRDPGAALSWAKRIEDLAVLREVQRSAGSLVVPVDPVASVELVEYIAARIGPLPQLPRGMYLLLRRIGRQDEASRLLRAGTPAARVASRLHWADELQRAGRLSVADAVLDEIFRDLQAMEDPVFHPELRNVFERAGRLDELTAWARGRADSNPLLAGTLLISIAGNN